MEKVSDSMKNKFLPTQIACYIGFTVQAIVNNFLPILFVALQDIYGLGYEKLARLIVINFGTQIITDLCAPTILKKLGYRRSSALSQATAAVGLILLGVLPNVMSNTYLAISMSAVIYAVGSGLMEVILSPLVENIPSSNKAGSMAITHSFYCWGQAFTIIVTTILISFVGFKGWNYIPLIWAIIPSLNFFLFTKVPMVNPPADEKLASLKELLKRSNFKGYMVMMLCAGASEIAMAQWASLFAQRALGVDKVIGDLAGPCAFALCMASARVFYGINAKKISFKKLLMILSVAAFVCYMAVALVSDAVVSLIFCAVCGFTVSVFWPGIYSIAAEDFPDGGMVMYGVFACCGDIGCALGPWVLGIVADYFNLNVGFGVVAFFPVLMFITNAFTLKSIEKSKV